MPDRILRLLLPALLVGLAACDDEPPAEPEPPADAGPAADGEVTPPSTVTYHADVRPIIERRCMRCHASGGIGPLEFTWRAEDWTDGPAWWTAPAANAALSGRMPPWMPADDCRPIEDSRALSDAELETLRTWQDEGFPEGDPADFVAPEAPPPPPAPDVTLYPTEGYTPPFAVSDEYRCVIAGAPLAETTYVRGVDVLPDQRPIVHHVLVYAVPPEYGAELDALDAAEPGSGYFCFGGPAVGGYQLIDVWLPSSQPTFFPEGSAFELAPGTRIVMQMHYNGLGLDGPAAADRSGVALWTMPAGEVPTDRLAITGFADLSLDIPAGEPRAVNGRELPINAAARIIGTVPHMHTLGSEIRGSIAREGSDDACVIDIDDWDFDWQQTFLFEPEAHFDVAPGDRLRLECVFDNSPANQPVVDGQQIAPRDVQWGEGTLDEMCLLYLIYTTPFEQDVVQCGGFERCVSACAPDDGDCFTRCHASDGLECATCHFGATRRCAQAVCPAEGGALLQCLAECQGGGGGVVACLLGQCADAMNALYVCIGPSVLGGTCNDDYGACGTRFGDAP